MRYLPPSVADAVSAVARARMAVNDALVDVDRAPSTRAYDELFAAAVVFEAAASALTERVVDAQRHHARAFLLEEAS